MRRLTFVEQNNHMIHVTLYISKVIANTDFAADCVIVMCTVCYGSQYCNTSRLNIVIGT